MSKYLLIFINSASSFFFIKTVCSFLHNSFQNETQLDFVLSKIKKLQDEITHIHIIIDTLEDKVNYIDKKITFLEKNITNNFLTSNYDMINLSINTH